MAGIRASRRTSQGGHLPSVPSGDGRARPQAVAGGVGLLVVLTLVLADAPTPVRAVLCLPLLLGISGVALCAVLVPEQHRLDALTRAGLVLLLGLAMLLASALLVAMLFRDGLPATRVVLVQALLSAVPLVIIAMRGIAVGGAGPLQTGRILPSPTVWSGVAGVALLAGALVLGVRLIPAGSPAPTFSFTGSAATTPGPSAAPPGGSVSLGWALRNVEPQSAEPPIQAVLDGRPVDVTTVASDARPGEYTGTTTLAVPTTPGLHRIVLGAAVPESTTRPEAESSQRLELVTYVDVSANAH